MRFRTFKERMDPASKAETDVTLVADHVSSWAGHSALSRGGIQAAVFVPIVPGMTIVRMTNGDTHCLMVPDKGFHNWMAGLTT